MLKFILNKYFLLSLFTLHLVLLALLLPSPASAFTGWVNYQGRAFNIVSGNPSGFITPDKTCYTIAFEIARFSSAVTSANQNNALPANNPAAGAPAPTSPTSITNTHPTGACGANQVYIENGLFNVLLNIASYDNNLAGSGFYGIRFNIDGDRNSTLDGWSAWQPLASAATAQTSAKLAGSTGVGGGNPGANVLGNLAIASTGGITTPWLVVSGDKASFSDSTPVATQRWTTAATVQINNGNNIESETNPNRAMRFLQYGDGGGYGAGISWGASPQTSNGWLAGTYSSGQYVLGYEGGNLTLWGSNKNVDGTADPVSFAPYVTFASSGNVGVGTAAPSYKLDFYNAGASNNAVVAIRSRFTTSGDWAAIRFGDYTQITDYQKAALIFEGDGSGAGRGKLHLAVDSGNDSGSADPLDAKLTVQSNGNVGIGTTSPANKLHVAGSIGATGWVGAGCEVSCDNNSQYSLMYASGDIANTGNTTTSGTTTTGSLNTDVMRMNYGTKQWVLAPSGDGDLGALELNYYNGSTWLWNRLVIPSSGSSLDVNMNLNTSGRITTADLNVQNNATIAGAVTISGWLTALGPVDLGDVRTDSPLFPGRVDVLPSANGTQGAWYIGSDASYGLASNTGLNLKGNLYINDKVAIDSTISGPGWHRSYSSTGWYNQTHGGGWWMTDSTWVRSYNDKSVYTTAYMRADQGFDTYANPGGYNLASRRALYYDGSTTLHLAPFGDGFTNVCLGCGGANIDLSVNGVLTVKGRTLRQDPTLASRLNTPDDFRAANLVSDGGVYISNSDDKFFGPGKGGDPSLVNKTDSQWFRIGGSMGLHFWGRAGVDSNDDPDVQVYTDGNLYVNNSLCLGGVCKDSWPTSGASRMQVFNDSGTFVVPAGVTNIMVEVWGGGGGGGGAVDTGSQDFGGGGGGAGGYGKDSLNVNPNESKYVTIGGGGGGGAIDSSVGGKGSDGGSSSFNGQVVASSGGGGTGAQAAGWLGGVSGTGGASAATFNISGGRGWGGLGGDAGQGGAGAAPLGYGSPSNGQSPGGGGSGGQRSNGGVGAKGRIVIYY